MADVIHTATAQLIRSVDATLGGYVGNPAYVVLGKGMTAQINTARTIDDTVPVKFRKIVKGNLAEMGAIEKAAVSAAETKAESDAKTAKAQALDIDAETLAKALVRSGTLTVESLRAAAKTELGV